MSEFFKWTENEYGLGVHEMDEEHQLLISKMNRLYAAAEKGEGFSELKGLIDDLANYTVQHFSDEEKYMEKIGFTGLTNHKIIHQQLLKQFEGHVNKFNETREVDSKFFDFLKVWLSAHIRSIDMKYGDFAKNNKMAA